MRFVLYGVGGVCNYGCEAIVRGTAILIRKKWPEAIITYVTPRLNDDINRLRGTGIEILPIKEYRRYEPKKIIRKAASLLSLPWDPFMERLEYLNGVDVVLSIGGDLYTLAADGIGYARKLIQFGESVMRKNKKFIIWGASIGPFEKNEKAKKAYVEHLRRVDLITVREPLTIHYLAQLGLTENVVQCADPAFFLNNSTFDGPVNNKRLRIGINYSPLSASYALENWNEQDVVSKQIEVLCKLIERFNADVALIPHVINPSEPVDDDYAYLKNIEAKIPNGFLDRVHFVDNDPGFIGLRDVLESCDIVIAARMHCAINAISRGIPTIFISYSAKSEGMVKYVYDNSEWIVSLHETASGALIDKVNMMVHQKRKIREHLIQRIPNIKKDALNAVDALERVLSNTPA